MMEENPMSVKIKEEPLDTQFCVTSSTEMTDLSQETNSESPSEIFQCKYCPKYFGTQTELEVHTPSHRPGQSIQFCALCNRIYPLMKSFDEHMINVHGPDGESRKKKKKKKKSRRKIVDLPVVPQPEPSDNDVSNDYEAFVPQDLLDVTLKVEPNFENQQSRENCPWFFQCDDNFVKPETSHVEHKTHFCAMCNKIYATLEAFERHLQKVHGHGEGNSSKVDAKRNEKEGKSKKKRKPGTSKKYTCKKCGEMFIDHFSYRHHAKIVHNPFICDFCGAREYYPKRRLVRHIMNAHLKQNENNLYFCDTCGGGFHRSSMLKRHVLRVHVDTPNMTVKDIEIEHKCPTCGKMFTKAHQLAAHFIRYHNPFICDFCGKEFGQKHRLLRHVIVKHLKALELLGNEKKFLCAICGFVSSRPRSLKTHILSIHFKDKTKPREPKEPKNPLQCDLCGKILFTKQGLSKHVKQHTNGLEYVCKDCPKAFYSYNGLKGHRINHHSGLAKPIQCHICSVGFSYKSAYERHMVSHTDEKPYKCEICDKRFAWPQSISSHMLVHSEKKLSCEFCPRKFRTKQQVVCHKKARHAEAVIGKPPELNCTICSVSFSTQKNLAEHLLLHM